MLVYLMETILYFQWCVRQSCEVENAVIKKNQKDISYK